jgi:DNA-directed RNA polymerase specialized sigma24 family protein
MIAPELQKFFAVLRGGDREALGQMLREHGRFLQSVIRLRLLDGRLRRVMDTDDVFQSLLKDFLSRKEGQLPTPDAESQMRAYLSAAAHHKIEMRARKERRNLGGLPDGCEPVSPEPAADRGVEGRDFLQAVRSRLSEENRRLFDLKAQGLTWPEIAAQVGGLPDALRMRLSRAVAAVMAELGQEGSNAP